MENSHSKIWDVAVIGAGASGLMASVVTRRAGTNTLLLDSQDKVGTKILVSGGGRCNLTNREVSERNYATGNLNALRSILKGFSSDAAILFFKELGVETTTEDGGKIFPTTHSSKTVLNAFLAAVEKDGVFLVKAKKVAQVVTQGNIFQIQGQGFSYLAKTVIVATGGLSYPATGSDGLGYEIARSFGHTIVPTSPSLVPLLTDDTVWRDLAGISLPVRLSFFENGKKKASSEGDFLFTHIGFSGPALLDMSRYWIRADQLENVKLICDFLPAEKEEDFRKIFVAEITKSQSGLLKNFLSRYFPIRLAEAIMKKSEISDSVVLNQLKKMDREKLIQSLFHFPLLITGNLGYEKAEVTAGGVSLAEVDRSTLESKLQPGLFFAGEILDVDGHVGGFNFQWAWASGTAAARGAIRRISIDK